MASESPPILRPIPRRPFANSPAAQAASHNEDADSSPPTPNPNAYLDFSRLLPPNFNTDRPSPVSDTELSRPPSYMNLTSSTLFGIFAPTSSSKLGDGGESVQETPWGTGAQTPLRRPTVDDATYNLMRDRAHLPRQRSSVTVVEQSKKHLTAGVALGLAARVVLLFALGVGYGVLVTHFHEGENRAGGGLGPLTNAITTPGFQGGFLAFWGLSGVFLGTLLPYADSIWEDNFGVEPQDVAVESVAMDQDGVPRAGRDLSVDLMSVVRPIIAFVGIAFAIRKLAWTSTLQVSLTLALTNPLLWWIIDRSLPGLLLSAFIAVSGSAFLLQVNPMVMPAPHPHHQFSNATVSGSSSPREINHLLGGLVAEETLESGMWLACVLFCSCLCFGNIGRRLAWNQAGGARGQFGGLR